MKTNKGINKKISILSIIFICIILFSNIVYANSSWRWLTSSPRKLLPIAVISTLMVEFMGVLFLGKVKGKIRPIKVLGIVALANIVSFVFPYIVRAYLFRATAGTFAYAWEDAFEAGPFYIVLFGYLILTILLELPLVYSYLKKYTSNKKALFKSVIGLNLITTIIVAVLERILYYGQW
ncbi:MAG: hypothetical protein GX987_09195 [Tissierellia bacterium]|nr:hypothetical protein [Tissierellia bacterium]